MPLLLLALWREQQPKGYELVQIDFTSETNCQPCARFE